MTILDQLKAALAERYDVERELGAGGMATVYLAEDRKHRRQVAIKVLRPELSATLGKGRFLREIELAAGLQHPHIVPVYDSGEAAGMLYYVMPFVEGESLRDKLQREGRLPADEAVQLTQEVASALGYAHERGIVHRDIKPENILISGGHAVVADFGIARAINAASQGQQLTGTGLAIGTPAYMSPEQATASEDVGPRSDLYSLGCVAYEMLTGKQPFSGPTMQSVLTQAITGPRPRVRAERKDVEEPVDQAIGRAMASEPTARFATMAEFSRALKQGTRRGLDWRIGLVGAALVVAAVVAGWYIGGRRARGPVVKGAESIAVLPFHTSGPGVDYLTEGMVDLLSTNLNAVGGIRTVEPRSVLAQWRERGGNRDEDLDGALAVGRKVGAGSVVLGSITSTGNSVRLNATLYARDRQQLAAAQVEGSADSVLQLVDDLSLALMRNIWRSNEPIPSLRVSALTTTSVDAMREYLRGEQLYRSADWDSATAAFRRAIAADSTFALASFRLALTLGWKSGWQAPGTIEALNLARTYVDRMPERERRLLGAYRLFELGDPSTVDSLRRYLAANPADVDGWFFLGDAMYHMRPLLANSNAELLAAFDSVIRRDSSLVPAVVHPLELAAADHDSTRFYRYLALMREYGDSTETREYALAGKALWGAATDSALRQIATAGTGPTFGVMMAQYSDSNPRITPIIGSLLGQAAKRMDATARANMMISAAAVLVGLGRVEQARAMVDSLRAVNPQVASGGYLIGPLSRLTDDSFAGPMAGVINRVPLNNPFAWRTRVMWELTHNRPAEARRVIAEGLKVLPDTSSTVQGAARAFRGWASALEGDTATAIREMRGGLRQAQLMGMDFLSSFARFELALLEVSRAETREDGIRHLQNGFVSDFTVRPSADLALGRALEAAGDRAGAADAYTQFRALWKGADSSLQYLDQQAKEGLARVSGEGAN